MMNCRCKLIGFGVVLLVNGMQGMNVPPPIPEGQEAYPLSHSSSDGSSAASSATSSNPTIEASGNPDNSVSPSMRRRRSWLQDEIAPDALYASILFLIDTVGRFDKSIDSQEIKDQARAFYDEKNIAELSKLKKRLDQVKKKCEQERLQPECS